jgi:trehalose 6-phosphate phosphatase
VNRPDARHWPELWERAEAARSRLLLLDFDGTLAPFQVDRTQVELSVRARSTLRAITRESETRVGIVSGRSLDDLVSRFRDTAADLVGEHGWEEMCLGGARTRHILPESTSELLRRGYDEMRRSAPAERVERKRTAVVLHTRGLGRRDLAAYSTAMAAIWAPFRRRAELELRRIDGGWELRARGRHKGTAVASLIRHRGGGCFTVYIGDDQTDEDAFGAVARAGFAVRVGAATAESRAHAYLPGVDAVLDWLELWRDRFAATPAPA